MFSAFIRGRASLVPRPASTLGRRPAPLAAFAWGIALCAALAGLPPAHAAGYPSRAITIVVTFPPGGGTDLLARKLGERLARRIGQPVTVENRPGASGNVGARYVAESAPDGYTLLMVNSSFAINPGVFRSLPFSPKDDFAAVINVAYVPSVIAVPAASPVRDLAGWLDGEGEAHGRPVASGRSAASGGPGASGGLAAQDGAAGAKGAAAAKTADMAPPYGSCGNGTPQHLAGEMLARAAHRKLLHVPYGGCGPALNDVVAGQVGAAIVTASSAAPFIKAGRLRALAVTSPQRSPQLPDVPTVAEQGHPGYQLDQWHGLLARAGTPADVLDFLYRELAAIVAEPAMQQELRALGFNPASDGPAAFDGIIRADIDRFAALSRDIGLQVD